MDDLDCTGGFHWHSGDICYHFGVEGAIDNECTALIKTFEANAFVCSGIPGREYICLETQVARKYTFFSHSRYGI